MRHQYYFNILYKIVAENKMKIVVETLCLTLHTHKKCQITFLRDSTNHNSFQCKHILVHARLVVCRLKILAKMILPFLWFMTLDTHVCVCVSLLLYSRLFFFNFYIFGDIKQHLDIVNLGQGRNISENIKINLFELQKYSKHY